VERTRAGPEYDHSPKGLRFKDLRGRSKKKATKKAKKPAKNRVETHPGLVTRAAAAAAMGVEPNRINKWSSDGAPVAIRGSRGRSSWYDLEALKAWRDSKAENNALVMSVSEQKTRLVSAQAEKQERENLVRAGQLISKAEAVAEGQKVLAALRARLMKVPTTCVNRGLPREQEALVRAVMVEALRELAAWKLVAEEKAS